VTGRTVDSREALASRLASHRWSGEDGMPCAIDLTERETGGYAVQILGTADASGMLLDQALGADSGALNSTSLAPERMEFRAAAAQELDALVRSAAVGGLKARILAYVAGRRARR